MTQFNPHMHRDQDSRASDPQVNRDQDPGFSILDMEPDGTVQQPGFEPAQNAADQFDYIDLDTDRNQMRPQKWGF